MGKGKKGKANKKKPLDVSEEPPEEPTGVGDEVSGENSESKPDSERQPSEPKEPTASDELEPTQSAEGGFDSDMNRDDGAGPGKANEAGLWDDPWTQPEGGQGTSGEADPLEDAPDESEEPPAVEYLEEEPVATADLGPPIGISQAGDTLSPLEGGFSSFQDGGLTSTQSGPPDSGIEFLCNESDENPPAEADDVQSFVAEPTQPSEAPITWYCSGAQVTESLGEKVDSNARTHIQASLPNYAPTTWEAWVSFLSREKEAGSKGDFRRVMCYFTILKIFGQGRVQLLSDFAEHRRPIDVQEGDSMIIPAVDLPPAVFKRDYRRQKTKMKSVFIEPSMNEVHIEGKMQVLAILSYWVRQD